MCAGQRWRLAVVLSAALLLMPWPSCRQQRSELVSMRFAGGQGLSVSQEQLGAGEAATATQLEYFEDSLSIATTGGRGRGGRGRGGNLGAAAFGDVDRLQQLQLGIYHIAAAPKSYPSCKKMRQRRTDTSRKPYCNNYVPKPRDQKACATCVSQSVATAIQMAAAAAMQDEVNNWEVNAASLYYCTEGGRSCSTGYEIQENLYDVIDKAPELIRSSSCLSDTKFSDAANEPDVNSWIPECNDARSKCNTTASREQPWLKCTYQSLSTFWEIQRHIRNHGAVITRITIYDDFDVQFNQTVRNMRGEDLPPYRFNKTAKPQYGHAAVIVGYDNDNYTWTLLNSWGSGADMNNSRSKGITADGLFKIQMGVAGVGVPDQTFGVTCAPPPGSPSDPFGVESFYGHKPRKPVELINPSRDRLNLNTKCFNYRFNSATDTVASIVDDFSLDFQSFVMDQMRLQPRVRGSAWGYENVTYKLIGTYDAEELGKMLTTADRVLRLSMLKGVSAFRPFIQCTHYSTTGQRTITTCNSQTGPAECTRLGNGTVGCALHYMMVAVPQNLTHNWPLRVCNIRYPYLPKPADSQPRALKTLGLEVTSSYCSQLQCSAFVTDRHIGCDSNGFVTYIFTPDCWNKNGLVRDLEYSPDIYLYQPVEVASFTPDVVNALLTLNKLQALNVFVGNGRLPIELGGLTLMKNLLIRYDCMQGTFPAEWSWPKLSALVIGGFTESSGYQELQPGCGITGPLPLKWLSQMPESIKYLWLHNNKISGTLPPQYARWKVNDIQLGNNVLTGSIPAEYLGWNVAWLSLDRNRLTGRLPLLNWNGTARPGMLSSTLQNLNLAYNGLIGGVPSVWSLFPNVKTIDLSFNQLEGQVPLTWANMANLSTLELRNNPKLTGCVPVTPQQNEFMQVYYINTGITGKCSTQRFEVEGYQRQALDLFPELFSAPDASWRNAIEQALQLRPELKDFYGIPVGSTALYKFKDDVTQYDEATFIDVTFEAINGAFCITEMYASALNVNMTALIKLLPRLPFLRSFRSDCYLNTVCRAGLLPSDLPASAPASLKVFWMDAYQFRGSLPDQWNSWATVEKVRIYGGSLAGSLPRWEGMKSLKVLDLGGNGLTGTLPASYGTATWSNQLEELRLNENYDLFGTIPGTWASLKAQISLTSTGVEGCVPDQLVNTVDVDYIKLACSRSSNNTDIAALLALKRVFSHTGADLSSWMPEPDENYPPPLPGAPPGPPPYYCRKWAGIICNAANQVSGIRIAPLIGMSAQGVDLESTLIDHLSQLPGLQSIEFSSCNLQGSLPSEIAVLGNLKHLNFSHNPQLTGSLPVLWAGLTNLETLDITGCSVTGTLPRQYVALQKLREFHAAGNKGITGQLPDAWGLMKSLQVLDLSNASVTGSIPIAWVKRTARKTAAQQLLAELRMGSTSPLAQPMSSLDSKLTNNTEAAAALVGLTRVKASVLQEIQQVVDRDAAGDAIVALRQLQVVKLANNELAGSIPAGIKLLNSLRVLDMSNNRISGHLSLPLAELADLQELKLAGNKLEGPLPEAYVLLTNLMTLDLSNNSLTGPLPEVWVSLAQLETLNLASNMLSGTLPLLWGSMNNAATHKLRLVSLVDNPCMPSADLKRSIEDSGITRGGRVVVHISDAYLRSCTTLVP